MAQSCTEQTLAFSENQVSKIPFLTKTIFFISVGQNSSTMFSNRKQECTQFRFPS